MNKHDLDSAPLFEEFREFILRSHRVEHRRKVNCQRLSIVFIWRHDYRPTHEILAMCREK